MTLVDEEEILDGSRAWAKTQELFSGYGDPTRFFFQVDCGWYEAPLGEGYEGAFAVVRTDSDLEQLVGEVVKVSLGGIYETAVYVYVVGSEDIDVDFACWRYARAQLADLSTDVVSVSVRPLVRQ